MPNTSLPSRSCALCRGPIPIDRNWRVLYCSRQCRDKAQRSRYNSRYGARASHDPDALLKQMPPEAREVELQARIAEDEHLKKLSEEGTKNLEKMLNFKREGRLFEPVREEARTEAYPDDEDEKDKGQ